MENFTDIFGEDLSNLEALSDFSHFVPPGSSVPPGASGAGPPNPSTESNDGPYPYAQKMYNNDYPYRHPGYYTPPPPGASSASPPSVTPSASSTSASTPGPAPSSSQQYMRPFPSFNTEAMNPNAQTPMGWNNYGASPMGHPYRPGYRQPYPDRQSHYPRPHSVAHGMPQGGPQNSYPTQQHYPTASSASAMGAGRYPSPKGSRQPPVYPPYGGAPPCEPPTPGNNFPPSMQPDYGLQSRGSSNPMHNRASSAPGSNASMYRTPFPHGGPQPTGNAKSSNAVNSTPPNPISPATSSSSSSPAPSNNLRGTSPRGAGPLGSQPTGPGSLQQLEQMVMPSPKEPSRSPSSTHGATSSPMPPKTPHSPSVHSQNSPLSPQQWPSQQRTNSSSVNKSSNGPQAQKQAMGMGGMPPSISHTGPPGMGMSMGPMGGPRSMHPGMMMDRQHMGMRHPGMYGSHPGMGGQPSQVMGMQQAGGMMPHPGIPRGMSPHPGSHMLHTPQSYQNMQQPQMPNQYQGMSSNPVSSQIPPHQQMSQNMGGGASQPPPPQQQPPQPSPQQPPPQQQPQQPPPQQQQQPSSQPCVSQSQYPTGMPMTQAQQQDTSNSINSQSVPSSQNTIGQIKSPTRSNVIHQSPPSVPSESTVIGSATVLDQDDKSSSLISKPEINDQISQPDRDTSVVTPKLCEEGEYKSDHKDEETLLHLNDQNENDSGSVTQVAEAESEIPLCSASKVEEDPSSTTTNDSIPAPESGSYNSTEPKDLTPIISSPTNSTSTEPRIENSSEKVSTTESSSLPSDESPSSEIKSYDNQNSEGIQQHPGLPVPQYSSSTASSSNYCGEVGLKNEIVLNPHPAQSLVGNNSQLDANAGTENNIGKSHGYSNETQQVEIQHLNQQLSHLYTQPQGPQIQIQIKDLQNRLHHLQQIPSGVSQWGSKDAPQYSGGSTDYENPVDGDELGNTEDPVLKKGKKGPKPKKDKTPKEPKTPKEKKPRASKKKKLALSEGSSEEVKFEDLNNENENKILPEKNISEAESLEVPVSEATNSSDKKEKKLKIKNTTPKKPKPNKTLLQFTKKKRKRTDSGSDADLDATPPPSPKKVTDSKEKRRSGRNTQRKKYVDDVDLNLSEDENLLSHLPPDVATQMKRSETKEISNNEAESTETHGDTASGSNIGENTATGGDNDPSISGPNYAFVDTLAEDTMVVQIILASRSGSRELESDEEDENMRLVYEDEIKSSEVIVKRRGGPKEKAALAKAAAATLPEERKKVMEELENSVKKDESANKEISKDKNIPKVEKSSEKCDEEVVKKTEKSEKKSTEKVESKDSITKNEKPRRMIDVEEFLVKFKNFSYLHCQWLTEEELQRGDKRISQKIRRFNMKREKSGNLLEYTEDEPFNPDYVEVDRVLDYSEHTDPQTNVTTKHYLVKWRSLPYEDCTWELESDVDPLKIKDYDLWKNLPSADSVNKKRPRKDGWKKWEVSPVYKNGNQLRPYQLEGVNWLMFSWYNGRNCLLADEMGLGKTIQSLAFVDAILNYGIRGPFLVIAPLSTIPNWQREFELWSNMNVIVYHGSQTSRNMLSEYEMYYKDENGERIPGVYKFHCLITTYECVITDILELREIKWRACVIDEAHRLKNKNCKLLEGLSLLDLETRLLLSGTPLQNNINELFSLLSFLEPSQFNSQEAFIKEFGDMQNEAQVTKLQALLKPLMLRRMKEDVEKSLKPKEETIVEVELTNMQKKYYRGILEKNFSFLSKGTSNANVPNLMNTMMELRKCCIHPYLLNGAEEQIQEEYRSMHDNDPEGVYFNSLTRSSGKMVLLDKLLPKLKEGGHRVLIFSQMVKMLDILEDYLIRKKYQFERIDGRIRGNLRQAAIDRYCRPDSDRFVFLLCTKAGGLGINLVAADTCIIYDSDWNPQNDLQAQARCHRIGQSKMVKIYRLITRNTYEREMFDKASLKLGLDKAVLQSMNTSQGSKATEKANTLSKKEIEDLLRKGAYGALMDDENAGDKFCEEDIEEILQRRTTTVTLENEKAGGSFSKASFTSADTADIAIDDPDFWAKWAKRAEVEEVDEKTSLMVNEPRSRKKIQRFGGHDSLNPQDVSDLDSDSDSDSDSRKGRKCRSSKKRRGKDYDDDYMEDERDVVYGSWSKNELFRIEKSLMAFGWGRWDEILIHSNLRKGFNASAIKDACRMILLYCLNTYKGDEKIKGFVWDLISPYDSSADKICKNHSGLSGPVPRGNRKNRKIKRERGDDDSVGSSNTDGINWVSDEKYDLDTFLDKSYRKHLDRNSNKVLLRVRMLYYLRVEVLGDHIKQIGTPGCSVSDLPLVPPPCDGPPIFWWDVEADKSLLVGTYRHGYERYNMMRLDPDLSFLSRCGPPDSADIQEELKAAHSVEPDDNSKLDEEEDSLGSKTPSDRPCSNKAEENDNNTGFLRFPSQVDLNGRLRRLISTYQREFKREEARQAAKDKRNEKRERIEQVMREREIHRIDMHHKKWTKKEESDFLNTLLVFGVECSKEQRMVWDRFRHISKLERKSDDILNEYYISIIGMCKKILGKSTNEEDADSNLQNVSPDILSDERAKKVLVRMELFRKIREDIINDENLEEKLELCDMVQDLPEWWIPGLHDKDLLLGAARHGIQRMEYYVLNDPELSFKDIVQRHSKGQSLIDEKNMELFNERRKKNQSKESHNSNNEDEEVKDDDEESDKSKQTLQLKSNGEEDKDDSSKQSLVNEKRKASITIAPPTLSQMEQMAKGGLLYDIEMMNELMAQSYAAAIKWPKDQILKLRLDHVIQCIETNKWNIPNSYALGDNCDMSPLGVPPVEDSPTIARDTATPLSESGLSETSTDDNTGRFNKRNRGRRGLLGSTETIATTVSTDAEKSKIRSLLVGVTNADDILAPDTRSEWDNYIQSLYGDTNKDTKVNSHRSNVEVSSVNGDSGSDPILDLKKNSTNKGSKLESALDKIGLAKRKLSDDTKEDKTKKKKRLDDIMFGLGAAKGVNLDKNGRSEPPSSNQNISKKDVKTNDDSLKAVAAAAAAAASGKVTDLNKLQDILTPLAGSPAEAKVQKWLADQMGVVPERPITPSAATATSTSFSKSPKSSFSSNPMEWMSNVSGDEHVTVFNRITGKKLSGTAGPKLKFLAQWLIDNPMFEVDPKWAEVVKSRDPSPGDKRKGSKLTENEPGAKKIASGVGPSFSTSGMSGLGLDPKNPMSSLSALDPKNPLSLSALYGIDPKKLDPVTAAMLGFGDPKNPMKMDPMMMAAMGLDSKTLQSMGMDPKLLQSMRMDSKTLQSMGMDPKTLQAMGMDPKILQSMGMDPKILQSMGMDPKTLQAMGMDPKILQSMGMDPKILQSMGMDSKTLQAMGMDPKTLQAMGMDPKTLQAMGMDPKVLQSMGMDPKVLQSMGMDPKVLQSMGMDPKVLQSMGMDPKVLQSMGMDPKFLQNLGIDSKLAQSMGLDPKMLQMMGIDQKTLQAMAMDPKSLQAMGIDPKMAKHLGLDSKSMQSMGMDPKVLQSLGLDAKSLQNLSSMDPKILQSMGIDPRMFDPKVLQSMGIDPKILQASSSGNIESKANKTDSAKTSRASDAQKSSNLDGSTNLGIDLKKMDPSVLMALGIDPKNPKIDPVTLSALGLDPKNPNPNLMAALAMMDPNQLSALYSYGMVNPAFMGMDMGGRNNRTPTPVSKESVKSSAASPRGSRASPSPRPPSRASVKSDTDRRSPRTSVPSSMSVSPKPGVSSASSSLLSHSLGSMDPRLLQAAGLDPKTLSSLDPKLFGMDPRLLGLGGFDPKALASMDPKLLQAAGIDMKMLQAFDPKLFAGIDPKLLTGLDPKLLSGMDPKLLTGMDPKLFGGIDPKLLAGMDPKLLTGMDPKLLAGMDPKLFAGMDPKFLCGIDPKFLAGMDPKQFLGGLDPKMLGFDPKLFGLPESSKSMPKTSASSSMANPLTSSSGGDPRLLGLDLKMLQGLDSKALQRLGLDPKLVASLLNGGSSSSPNTSKSASSPSSSGKALSGKSSTISTYSSLDPRMFTGFDPKLMSAYGFDPKLLSSMDPKLLSSMDPKFLAGLDPKLLSAMDPKLLGVDPKLMSGFDPKLMGIDPKLLGLDPKSLASMDPKLLASFGIDPKMLSNMDSKLLAALDPKLLGGIDPKSIDPKHIANMDPKVLGFDPKAFLAGMDPSLASMYGLGYPSSSASSSISNGVPTSQTSKLGSSSTTCKPKPGTVAAALAEKKKEAAAASSQQSSIPADSDNESLKSGLLENPSQEDAEGAEDEHSEYKEGGEPSEEAEKFETRKGLTSEERVLLREKKRERLLKEKDSSDSGEDSSVKKKGSKLESVLDKLVDSKSEEQSSSDK
uniref:Chromodomain-helicase-DNA-binding protein 7 n=1 Tax=Lepeophtheirus salmonis TaxID=72036 RepID=A0A0K2SWV2_LEPSM